MQHFWRSLEEVRGLAATSGEWQRRLAPDFELLKAGYLRRTGRVAEVFPCPIGCGCAHRLHPRARGTFGAVCDCEDGNGCEDFTVTAEEAAVWELDMVRFGGAVCRAFGCRRRETKLGLAMTWQIGVVGKTLLPVFLSVHHDRDEFRGVVANLVATHTKGFILLTPTDRLVDAQSQALLKGVNAGIFHLESNLFHTSGNELKSHTSGEVLFAPYLRAVTTAKVGPKTGYSLKKQMGVWELHMNGQRALIDDERGLPIVAYLLRNPPTEPLHAVPLERKVWAYDVATSNAQEFVSDELKAELGGMTVTRGGLSGDRLNAGENSLLKAKIRELLATVEDEFVPREERDKAEVQLAEIQQALAGKAGRAPADDASRAADRVRKAINRLHQKLATATDEKRNPNLVHREFAEHLNKHLIMPSARFNRGKGSRNRAGVAGTFTYEPPPGVVWER